jgi:hypothetical protein
MSWLLGVFLGIDAILSSFYFESEGAVGTSTLIVFNLAGALSLFVFYAIVKITSDK